MAGRRIQHGKLNLWQEMALYACRNEGPGVLGLDMGAPSGWFERFVQARIWDAGVSLAAHSHKHKDN
jgi:hypothetical protein